MDEADRQRSMGAWLSWHAEHDPDRPALTMNGKTLSRREVDEAANRLARDLASRGVVMGDRIAIVLPTGPSHQIACFAAWKLGATPIPLPPYAVEAELEHLLGLADAKIVLGLDPGRAPGSQVLPADYLPDPMLDGSPLPQVVSPVWKAVPSGGSTGFPKLIFENMPAVIDPARSTAALKIAWEDVMLHPAPAHHNSPFCQTAFALCNGAHVILMQRFDAEEWLRLVERHKVRWAYLVPTMMSRVLALPLEVRNRYDVSSIEVVFHMAAPCPEWVKAEWIDWLGPDKIWEIYGGTEGYGGAVITGREWLAHRGSVGRSAGPVEIRDDAGTVLPPGEIGLIHFGPFKAGTAATGQWRTYGDMGWLDEDGYLYLADRRTDVILTGGVNLYPAEIEGALSAHPAIATAVVVGIPDSDLGNKAHAVLELRPGHGRPDPRELDRFLRERLSWNKIPYSFELSDRMLRDDAGKVRRAQVRAASIANAEHFVSLR